MENVHSCQGLGGVGAVGELRAVDAVEYGGGGVADVVACAVVWAGPGCRC